MGGDENGAKLYDETGWVDIDGFYPYQVHPRGDIRSRRSFRILQGTPVARRYLTVTLRKDNANHIVYLHKVVCEAFLPQPARDCKLHYKNGNRFDCSVDNMEWVDK